VPYPDGTSAQIDWRVYTSPSNPFAPEGFNGSCQFPQITGQGLDDSRQHGKDLYDVYHGLLGFLPGEYAEASNKTVYRVTNNIITSQVAGQVISGMYPTRNSRRQVLIQPNSIDSLEPTYTCSAADEAYSSYGVGSTNPAWIAHLIQSKTLYAKLDQVSAVDVLDPNWHNWFDHYFDNLSSRLCHAKPLPCNAKNSSLCITEEDADAVFRRGEYEYSFIYRDSEQSLAASTASFGVWVAELASNMRQVMSGAGTVIYRHNIAHDASVSKLLSILQVDVMVWPGMGSEVVFELYSKQVLWGGQIMRSSNPSLGLLDLVPAQTFLAYIDGLVGRLARKVPGLCGGT
jgi:2-phosphoxylose phosphatase